MSATILTWNPNRWDWTDLPERVERVRSGTERDMRWSAGGTRNIAIGTRVYLLRQGEEPRGIMGSGWTTSAVYPDEHWDEERAAEGIDAYYVDWTADILLNPEVTPPLDVRHLPRGPASKANWRPQASGTSISAEAAEQLEAIWSAYTERVMTLPDVPDSDYGAVEGAPRLRLTRHFQRERALRKAKIAESIEASHDGLLRCEVPGCGFCFAETYGAVGKAFAHVHHLVPLAEADGSTFTQLNDLAIVCANCHAMIHRAGDCRPLEGLIRHER